MGLVASLLIVAALAGPALLAAPTRRWPPRRCCQPGPPTPPAPRGAKWRRVDFTVTVSGQSTLRLSWTGTADMRFTVFDAATGQKLGENLTGANPKSVTLNLQAGVAYYSRVWAASGVGAYTYVLVQGTNPTTTTTQGPTTTTTPPPSGRPNVVVINTDDMRPTWRPTCPSSGSGCSTAAPASATGTCRPRAAARRGPPS